MGKITGNSQITYVELRYCPVFCLLMDTTDQTMEDDLNKLSASVISNLDKINSILCTGRLDSKLLSHSSLPDQLLAMSQQEWIPSSDARSVDSSDRLQAEDVDAIFNKIRHRSSNVGSARQNRNQATKKAIPLQQSRILNETNLANSQSGSLTDLSDGAGKMKGIDVETLVKSLKQSAALLSCIENRSLEQIDFERVERFNKRECAKVCDIIHQIDVMVQDFQKFVTSERDSDNEKKELLSERIVGLLRDLSETMSQVIFIKNNEYVPDMSRSFDLDSFPLAECLDDVTENIRQKKLYQ
ncbi:uncharacterized protein LOC128733703 [Sabethes cyaneus]|uniref:uncharacterized protein LOC128733703 n=1 Tax=Sabethes cyaneus TaxID=53552 RepID=UPI00237D6A73|nr:uncharacterized protein LOC128733703 [Sabethes cyaneus]